MIVHVMTETRRCRWLLLPALALLTAACVAQPGARGVREPAAGEAVQALPSPKVREKPPVRTTRKLYEGSLWRGTASWGNLMRDHRARFRGDLLTIRDLGRIINVPDAPAEPVQENAAVQEATGPEAQPRSPIDPVLRFLEEQRKRQEEIEREQNDILRSIDQVEVEVVRVLRNGNLLVRGTHPPIFRDRNRVKYLFSIRGIVRPSDVDDENSLPSNKLSKAEYRIKRLVRRATLPLGALARAMGRRREGALLDRFTNFLTAPGGNRTGGTAPNR